MKKIVSIVLLFALMLTMLTACGTKSSDSATPAAPSKTRSETGNKDSNSVTFPISSMVNTLDPENYTLSIEGEIINNLYDMLFFVDDEENIVKVLAEDLDIAEDGSSVTVTLRSGVKFHSGDELTAEDVEYSIARSINSGIAAPVAMYSEIEVLDNLTFVMNFPYVSEGAGFYELTSYISGLYIVNKSFVEEVNEGDMLKDFGTVEDGTGAYILSSIETNGDITLVRNEEYWGTASIDTVNYKVITGDASLAFEAGDIDFLNVDYQNYLRFQNDFTNVDFIEKASNYVFFMQCNCSFGPMDDINVRKAAALAMNKDDVAFIASDGAGVPAYNLANPLVTYYADCCEHYDFNLEEAQKLMKDAGYSEENKCPVTLIVYSAIPAWVSASEIIKEQLDAAYFDVTIDEIATTERYDNLGFDLGLIGVGLTTSFGSFEMLFDNESGLNMAGIDGDEQAAVLEAFAAMKDEETTHAAMAAAVDSFAYLPIYHTMRYFACDSNLNHGEYYSGSSLMFVREMSW